MKELKDYLKQCISDGSIDKKVVPKLIKLIKESGGMSDETKRKISESKKGKPSKNKGRSWMCKPSEKISKLVEPSKIDEHIKDGWVKGRIEFQ